MLRVNGLYGHIQRNNAKAAVLIATLLGLFLVVQFSVRTVYFLQMAQAEANGMVLPPVRDSDPLRLRGKRNSADYSPKTRSAAVLPAGGNRHIRSFLDAAWPSPVQW